MEKNLQTASDRKALEQQSRRSRNADIWQNLECKADRALFAGIRKDWEVEVESEWVFSSKIICLSWYTECQWFTEYIYNKTNKRRWAKLCRSIPTYNLKHLLNIMLFDLGKCLHSVAVTYKKLVNAALVHCLDDCRVYH